MEYIYKQFQESVVKYKAAKYHGKIFCKLFPFPHTGFLENHVSAQVKPYRERKTETDKKSGDMRPYSNKRQLYRLFMQDEIVANKEKADIQTGIKTTAGGIAESLERHDFTERRVKNIHHPQNNALYVFMKPQHAGMRR